MEWSEMLPELLEMISDRLPLLDYLSFRHVCRHWRSSPSGRSEITNFPKENLWLMIYDVQDSRNDEDYNGNYCYIYSQSHPKPCTVRLPHLRGAEIAFSKFGWLLAHREDHFFFFSPLTFQKIDLPKHAVAEDQIYGFTVEPTHPSCVAFIISRWEQSALEVSFWAVGDAGWTNESVPAAKADIDTMLGILCCSCKIDADYYDNGSCECRWRNRVCIMDGQNYLSYNYADGWVESYGTYHNSLRGPLTAIHREMVAAHEIEWEERFGEGSRVCLSTSALMVHPPLDGISGRAACKPSEQNKLKVVKATLLEPVFGSKERS